MRKNTTWLTVWASINMLSPNCSSWREARCPPPAECACCFTAGGWSDVISVDLPLSTSTWLCVIGAQPTHLCTLSTTNIVSYPSECFINRGEILSFECWRPLLGCLMRIVFWYVKTIIFKTERTRITGPGFKIKYGGCSSSIAYYLSDSS